MEQEILTKEEKVEKLKAWFGKTVLDKEINRDILGVPHSNISPQALLDTSKQLLKINRGEAEACDRDSFAYSTFLGPEHQLEQSILKDAGKLKNKASFKIRSKRNLSWLTPGFWNSQTKGVTIGNSLAENVEGYNPMSYMEAISKISKFGAGGLPSDNAIPAESRLISPSSFPFVDSSHNIESSRIGTVHFSNDNVLLGKDKKLYKLVKDNNDKLSWVDHETLLKSTVSVPEH